MGSKWGTQNVVVFLFVCCCFYFIFFQKWEKQTSKWLLLAKTKKWNQFGKFYFKISDWSAKKKKIEMREVNFLIFLKLSFCRSRAVQWLTVRLCLCLQELTSLHTMQQLVLMPPSHLSSPSPFLLSQSPSSHQGLQNQETPFQLSVWRWSKYASWGFFFLSAPTTGWLDERKAFKC